MAELPQEVIDKILTAGIETGRENMLHEIIDYVKSDEFIDNWNRCPRGTRFGDFFAELLEERNDG